MQHNSPSSPIQRRTLSLLWLLIAAAVCVTPLVFERAAEDAFRIPKDVVFQILALAILAVGAGGALWSDAVASTFRTHRPALLVALAATAWTALAALASLKPEVSFFKPFTVFCFAVFFTATVWTGRERSLAAVPIVFIPALVNAAFALLQAGNLWSPWGALDEIPDSLRASAVLGNPNEVGGFFVLPIIACISAAMVWRRRYWLAIIALVLIGGLVAGHSVTSIAATVAGLAALLALPAARGIRKLLIGSIALVVIVVVLIPVTRDRVLQLGTSFASANFNTITSRRAPSWAIAVNMFRERPLTGVGPGVFGALYMPYKLRIDERFPQWTALSNENFGEAHNEYLQLLAETGAPGLAIFVAALFLFGRLSFPRDRLESDETAFVRVFALPAAVAFGVLAMAHFPLHLTATMVPALYLAALSFAWSTR